MQNFLSKQNTKIVFHVSIILFSFIIWRSSNKLLTTDVTFTKESFFNDECSFKNQEIDQTSKSLCTISNQYSKFVWMMIDAMAFDEFETVLNNTELMKTSYNLYRVMNPNYKNSAAVYSTYFTGQFVSNFAGKPIVSDNIFNQFQLSDYTVNMVGAWGPSVTLMGTEAFSSTNQISDSTYLFESLFGTSQSSTTITPYQTVQSKLDEYTDFGSQCLYVASGKLDSYHHRYTKHGSESKKILNIWTKNMVSVFRWINSHPDYLLIITSDHGGDTYPQESRFDMHGPKDGGNEAFFFTYNPKLQQRKNQKEWIMVVDVSSSIALHVMGVSIPAESIGAAVPPTDDPMDAYKVHQLNLHQLTRLAKKRGISPPTSLTWDIKQGSPPADLLNQMAETVSAFSKPLAESKVFPFFDIMLFIPLMILALVVYAINFSGVVTIQSALHMFGDGAAFHVIFLGSVFWNAWFNYWKYHEDFTQEKIYWYFASAFVSLYYCHHDTPVHTHDNNTDIFHPIPHYPPTVHTHSIFTSIFDQSPSQSTLPAFSSPHQEKQADNPWKRILNLILFSTLWNIFWMISDNHQWLTFHPQNFLLKTIGMRLASLSYIIMVAIILFIDRHSRDTTLVMEKCMYLMMLLVAFVDENSKDLSLFRYMFYICLIHVGILLFSSWQAKRRIVFPAIMIYFLLLVNGQSERFCMLTLDVVQYYVLTTALEEALRWQGSSRKVMYGAASVFILLCQQAFWSFVWMEGEFSMDLDPNVPSIPSPGDEPLLAGILMLWRKYGPFMLKAAFAIRGIHAASLNLSWFGPQSHERQASATHHGVLWFSLCFFFLNSLCLELTFSLVYWHYMTYVDIFMLLMIFSFDGLFYCFAIVTPNLTSKIFNTSFLDKLKVDKVHRKE